MNFWRKLDFPSFIDKRVILNQWLLTEEDELSTVIDGVHYIIERQNQRASFMGPISWNPKTTRVPFEEQDGDEHALWY